MAGDHARHSHASSARFLARLLPDREHLHALLDPRPDVLELLGCALWDVFSNNHSVVDAEGTAHDLGSFRASADFIGESINRRYDDPARSYGYLDFYMGTAVAQQPQMANLYRWIFMHLKGGGCRWIYSFPRLYIVDLGRTLEAPDFTEYDPSDAVGTELEQAERAERVRELVEKLDSLHEEQLRRARRSPLPTIVAAHRDVFGRLPEGWPHPDM